MLGSHPTGFRLARRLSSVIPAKAESILFSDSLLLRSVDQHDSLGEIDQLFANHRGIVGIGCQL